MPTQKQFPLLLAHSNRERGQRTKFGFPRFFSPFHAASSRPIILPIRGGCCSRKAKAQLSKSHDRIKMKGSRDFHQDT